MSESNPEVHVEAPGRHHWISDQRIINPDIAINLRLHRDGFQHGVHMNQGSVIQSRADLEKETG